MKKTKQVLTLVCLGLFNGNSAIKIDQFLSNSNSIDLAESNYLYISQKAEKRSKMRTKDEENTITAMAAKSNGLDTSDNILVKTEYQDLVQEI